MISLNDAENKIIDAIRKEINSLWTEGIQPSQDRLIEEINKNHELNEKNKDLSKELTEKAHYIDLLSSRIKTLEEDVQSFQKVSMISKWEKKVKEVENTKSVLEKQILGLKAQNSHLNIQLEELINVKIKADSKKRSEPEPEPVHGPEPEPEPKPVPEPESEPVPEPEPEPKPEPVPEPKLKEEVEPEAKPAVELEIEITYTKKSLKGTDYYIGSNNIVYNMDYTVVGEKNGKKIKLY